MLAYTSIDDAFSPLSTPNPHPLSLGSGGEARHKRRRRTASATHSGGDEEAEYNPPLGPAAQSFGMPAPPMMHSTPPAAQAVEGSESTLARELVRMMPYLLAIFMVLVLAMLYDMRNTMHDMRLLLHEFSTLVRARATPMGTVATVTAV